MSTDFAKKVIDPKEIIAEPVGWLLLLPRWSLMTGLTTLMIPIVFLGAVGQQVSDYGLGTEYVELLQAVRSPGMFRVAWAIDAVIWLMLGGTLITFAGMLRRHAPIRGMFITVCGIAQLFGTLGSFLRLDGISDLAALYVVALPDQQTELLRSYLSLQLLINSSNHIAVLLQGAGFLLVSWSVLSLRGFPRWLAVWLALPGLLAIAQFGLFVIDAAYLFLLNVAGLIAGNIALNFAITLTLWRPSKLLISSVGGENAGK